MQGYIGLTKAFVDELIELEDVLDELGYAYYKKAHKDGLLTDMEAKRFELAYRVRNNPEINLWDKHPSTL